MAISFVNFRVLSVRRTLKYLRMPICNMPRNARRYDLMGIQKVKIVENIFRAFEILGNALLYPWGYDWIIIFLI